MPTKTPSRPRRDTDSPEYVLGTGEQESDRLGLQNRLWSASAHLLWERAGLRPGMTILDVGCGPGHATLELAEITGPSGRVIAIDESPLFLKHLNDRITARRLTNVERFLGDAQQLESLLPQYTGKADLAYVRWVLCFVPDPEAVIRGIATLLKPGGRIAIQDYFNYESMALAPKTEAFARVIKAIGESWRARGGDPDIVSRLPGLFRKHGLELDDIRLNQRVARPNSTIWAWPDAFWRSYLPRMVEMEAITPADRDAFEAQWKEACKNPDAFMLLPPVFDLVAIKREMDVTLRNLGTPDETRTFANGRYDVFRIGGLTIGRSTFEPGWKWSRDNGPAMGLALCPLEHVGLVLSGMCAVSFQDGREIELRAGQFFHVPPEPHDSWVIGSEQYIALHFHAADVHMRDRAVR